MRLLPRSYPVLAVLAASLAPGAAARAQGVGGVGASAWLSGLLLLLAAGMGFKLLLDLRARPPSSGAARSSPSSEEEKRTASLLALVEPAATPSRADTVVPEPRPEEGLPVWLSATLERTLGRRYRDLELLGSGGMGTVVAAWDSRLGRRVAIKVPPPHLATEAEFRARFLREAQALGRLSHENVAVVHDVPDVPEQEIPVMIMEFLEGTDLMTLVRDQGLPPVNDTLAWILQAASGLHHAHQHGICHRDVKPANLMVTRRRVKLLDFGLAAMDGSQEITQAGMRLGSGPYMPPEQMAGERVDHLADQYALAVTAYFLFSGKLPFDPTDPIRDPVPTLSAARPGLPPEFDAVFRQALAPAREDRYPSTEAFTRGLHAAARAAASRRG